MPRPVRAEDGNSPQQPEGGEGQKVNDLSLAAPANRDSIQAEH